jgi:hypothetical protein
MQIGYEHQFAFSQQRSGVIVWINLDIMNVYTAGMIRNPHVLLPHFLTNEFLRDSFLQLGLRVLNNWNWLASPVKDYAIKTESIGVFYDDLLQRASSWCFHLRNCQFCHMERETWWTFAKNRTDLENHSGPAARRLIRAKNNKPKEWSLPIWIGHRRISFLKIAKISSLAWNVPCFTIPETFPVDSWRNEIHLYERFIKKYLNEVLKIDTKTNIFHRNVCFAVNKILMQKQISVF